MKVEEIKKGNFVMWHHKTWCVEEVGKDGYIHIEDEEGEDDSVEAKHLEPLWNPEYEEGKMVDHLVDSAIEREADRRAGIWKK